MMDIKQILLLIIFLAIFIGFFYGLYKLGVMMTLKRSKTMTDDRLLKQYQGTSRSYRILVSIVAFMFMGGPIGAVLFFYFFKTCHQIYHDELVKRNITFEPVA